jgi:hypothetical protein
MLLRLDWVVAGVIIGMLIASVMVPPTRKEVVLPQPEDNTIYFTDTGCVRMISTEVPCGKEADSLNLIASLGKK